MRDMTTLNVPDHEVYAPIAEIVFYAIEMKTTSQDYKPHDIHYKLLQEYAYGKTALFNEFELSVLKRIITTWQDLDVDDEGKVPYSDIASDEEYDRHLRYLEDNAEIALKAITEALQQMG